MHAHSRIIRTRRDVQHTRQAQRERLWPRPLQLLLLQPPHAERARVHNVVAAAPDVGRNFSARERSPISVLRPIPLPARDMVRVVVRGGGGSWSWIHMTVNPRIKALLCLFGLSISHSNEAQEWD